MNNNNLELLASALRTAGVNLDIPTLDLILTIKDIVDKKGLEISLGDIGTIRNDITIKYSREE